jgi:hypothetical protein
VTVRTRGCKREYAPKKNRQSERHFGLAINEPAVIPSGYMRL